MATEKLTPPSWPELLRTAVEMPGEAGNTYNRFRNLSFGNQALLMWQGVFEPVHTYKGWLSLGRQVQKGSHAKSIYVPLFRKEEDKDGKEREHLSGFRLVPCMFGVSETEGDDLPPFEPPMWSKAKALTELKVSETKYESVNGNAQGYSFERSFAINPVAVYPFKTMLHELGHIVAGHTSREGQAEYLTHRGVMEFQAEGAAYLILNELGLLEAFNAAESRAYIQGWLSSQTPDEKAVKLVFSTADKILRAGRAEEPEEAPEPPKPEPKKAPRKAPAKKAPARKAPAKKAPAKASAPVRVAFPKAPETEKPALVQGSLV